MSLAFLVLVGFVVAASAPLLHRFLRDRLGVAVAAYPALVFVALLLAPEGRESWAWAPELGLNLSFHLDGLSRLFGLLISGIGALVCVYAGGYLKGDNGLGRFLGFLLAFMASMLGLVLSDNLLALFIFWEGTSITSFLLIGYKHKSEASRRAALQALLTTGGGGLALLAGALLIGITSGSFEISQLSQTQIQSSPLYAAILTLVCVGAFTKSAQFPFHFWLPGAMEAPTPVSAYLHSATMVKAGVYLLARMQPTLGGTETWTLTLSIVGGATMVAGAVLALGQRDLKRLLAYSTVAALGTLVFALGLGAQGNDYGFRAFATFLTAHALYKGALFMVAGAVDHETGTRDLVHLGGLRRAMPFTAFFAVVAALALAGAGPFLAFIGKELLFEAALKTGVWWPIVVALCGASGFAGVAFLVAFRTFFGTSKATPKPAHEAPLSLWIGPAILASLGVLFGLFPAPIEPLLKSVANATAGREVDLHLELWHGFNVALAMSALSVAGGAFFFWLWPRLHPLWSGKLGTLVGPARVYDATLAVVMTVARLQTRFFQNGYLRAYVTTIVVVTTILVALPLWRRGELLEGFRAVEAQFYEVAIAVLILLGAFRAVQSRSRLAALASLGVVGYCVALFYLFFGGPDLAMTQVLVDTLTVILFVLVFFHLPHFARLSSLGVRVRDAIVATAFGATMTALVLSTRQVQIAPSISPYFVENAVPRGEGRNIVNVILVDFRALDTLGEITVLALAAMGVFSLLRLRLQPTSRDTTRKNLVSDVFAPAGQSRDASSSTDRTGPRDGAIQAADADSVPETPTPTASAAPTDVLSQPSKLRGANRDGESRDGESGSVTKEESAR